MRLRVIGSTSLDLNRVGSRVLRKRGGVVTYAGLTALRLGASVQIVTSIGRGDLAQLEPLRRAGLEVRARVGSASTCFENHTEGDRRRQTLGSVADPIRAADLPRDDVDRVLLGALHPEDVAADVLGVLERGRAPVAADLQGWVRRIDEGVVSPGASPRLEHVLRLADLIKGDAEEIAIATRAVGCREDQLCERYGIDLVVVTCGRRGGRVLRGDRALDYDAPPVEVADPTGAGDVFFASVLVDHARNVLDDAEVAKRAAALAARQVAGLCLEDALLALDAPA
jgi:sugar/nucleoside kinase (ribokinase family)